MPHNCTAEVLKKILTPAMAHMVTFKIWIFLVEAYFNSVVPDQYYFYLNIQVPFRFIILTPASFETFLFSSGSLQWLHQLYMVVLVPGSS